MTSAFLQRTEGQMSEKTQDKDRAAMSSDTAGSRSINRRNILLGTSTLVAAATLTSGALAQAQKAAPAAPSPAPATPSGRKPNILVIFGDDIGQTNTASIRSA
jgi:arylsulfatase